MQLKTIHLFPFIKLIAKLNIKHEIKDLFLNKASVKDKTEDEIAQLQKEKGMDMVFLFIEKLPNAEKEFFEFFALYTGKSVDDLKEQEIPETIAMISALFKDESFVNFFRLAVK